MLTTNIKNSHFEEISTNCIQVLFSFLYPQEQLKTFAICSKFKYAFADMNSFDYANFKTFNDVLRFYLKVEKLSSKYAPYLNVYLNINILNILLTNFTSSNINIENQITIINKAFQYFLSYRTKRTNNNKLYISILPNDNVSLQTYIHFFKTYKHISNLKCTLYIANGVSLTNILNDMIMLYTLIPDLDKVESNYTKQCLHIIQQEIFKRNVKCMHLNVFSNNDNDIKKAVEYFKINNNCLKGINGHKQKVFCEYNQNSIISIKGGSPFEISDITSLLPNLIEIKFNYANDTFDKYFNTNTFTQPSNAITCIGGFTIQNEEDCDNIITFINSKLPFVNTLHNITFGNDEEDIDMQVLFKYLCSKLRQTLQIEHLTLWGYKLKKQNDYTYCYEHLPKLSSIWEDYDVSSWYDHRFEIDGVFACNTERQLSHKDLDVLCGIIENYLRHKEEGEKYIDIKLFCDDVTVGNLCKYCIDMKKESIVDMIGSVNYEVNASDECIKKFEGIKHLNWFEIKRENEMLFECVKGVKVDVVIVEDSQILKGNVVELMKSLKPYCVIFRKKLNEDVKEIDVVKLIGESVKVVVVVDQKECDKVKECYKELEFMVIANSICLDS